MRCSKERLPKPTACTARNFPRPERGAASYERWVMLTSLDQHWREHLAALDHLRQGIHLRGYAQKNPKQEYKREAFELFAGMLESVKLEVTKTLTAVQISSETELAEVAAETAPAVETSSTSTPAMMKRWRPMRPRINKPRSGRSCARWARSDATTLALWLGQEVQAVPWEIDLEAISELPKRP